MKRMLVAAIAVLVLAGPSAAQDPPPFDQVVQPYVANGQFMGSVLVARGPAVVFTRGYGSANLEWNSPNDATTKFRLGSLTKQFTAASILLLEERGKLSVDDRVKKYLPDAPAAWDSITIRHVLTHTSGIPNFTGFADYRPTAPFATTPEALVARFRDKPLDFQPGDKFNYSNSGYVLLGYLVEKISGGTYEAFLQQNIFAPLGMKDSGYDSNTAIIPRRAAGYVPGAPAPLNAGFVHMTIPFSAGALYSTTEDLLRWEQGLFGGKVLSAGSLEKMTTPFKSDYAFGVLVRTAADRKVISHNGGIDGFNTYLAYYPDSKTTIVVLGNLNGPAPDQIGPRLGAVAHGDPVPPPPAAPRKTSDTTSERVGIAVSPAMLGSYTGTYEVQPGFALVITLEGDQLMAQATGQQKFPLFAETNTRFFLKVVDAQIDFISGGQGGVTRLVLHQGGRDILAARK
jgi:CubicO group peptidase (beta-lactamase class C family)